MTKQFLYRILVIAVIWTPLTAVVGANNSYKMTIVLDPGHGGQSEGAISKQIKEKDLVLDVALKVGEKIGKNLSDVRVLYTRQTDTFITLEDRSLFANKNKADLFISIHANSVKKPTPFGTETFVMGEDKLGDNLEIALKENADIKFEENYETKYLDITQLGSYSIEFDMKQKMYFDQSFALANLIEEKFTEKGRNSRGVKPAPFLVLWHATMPSVLIEIGFISNKTEEAFLKTTTGRTTIANAIYEAVKIYKAKWEQDPLFAKVIPTYIPEQNHPIQTFRTTPPPVIEKEPAPVAKTSVKTMEKSTAGIRYHVQILSGKKIPLSSKEFKGETAVYAFKVNDGLYKYCIGNEHRRADAEKLLKRLREKFSRAFIISSENGVIK